MILHRKSPLALASALALVACGQADDPAAPSDGASAEDPDAEASRRDPGVSSPSPAAASPSGTAPAVSATPPPGYTDGSGINEGYPDLTPSDLTPEAARTEAGARDVLMLFARAIEMREYDQAWNMLGPNARTSWSRARFNALFDGLRDITVAVPGGTMEGAAGSSYYTSRATITASDADGRPIRLEGPLVLRRANDVPGASAAQLRWRIERAELTQTH